MGLADWTFGTEGGSYSVLVDATSPGTGTKVIDINQVLGAGQITVGSVMNGRMEGFIKALAFTDAQFGFMLRADGFDSSTSTAYRLFIALSGGNFNVSVNREASGGANTIATVTGLAPLTGANTDWQKWRFSAFSVGGITYVRVELWDGAAYVVVLDCADSNPTIYAASGTFNIYSRCTIGTSHIRFDDVKFYSLA